MIVQALASTSSPGISLGALRLLLSASLRADGGGGAFDAERRLTGLTQDTRALKEGQVFVARAGSDRERRQHAIEAAARGAAAVITAREQPLPALACPVLEVADVDQALARAAHAVHGEPSRSLAVIGITGTNGKTTTAAVLRSALSDLGARVASIGTLGFQFGALAEPSPFTTPPADQLADQLGRVRDGGGTHVVMEVSSHGLSQHRVLGVEFEVAAFSNLTQDHLDYHADFEAYGRAKARLFRDLAPRKSVLNVDDAFGRSLKSELHRAIAVSRLGPADVSGVDLAVTAKGVRGNVTCFGETVEIDSVLVGAHNADNLLLALGVLLALGFPAEDAALALGRAQGAAGRFERVDEARDDIRVLVDYAHTPDALRRALAAARELTGGRLYCVFGCGGDRDPTKRPIMGDVVGRTADVAIVTNDNPRSERPERIAEAILSGLEPHPIRKWVELDRAHAIQSAIELAEPGDVVVIAGKGHEPYQILGNERRPFDDRVEARHALLARRRRPVA